MSFSIVLDNPKNPFHVGAAVRMAACYGGTAVLCTGTRCKTAVDELRRIPREERMKDYSKVELVWQPKLVNSAGMRHVFGDWTPVCVEVDPSAELLPYFEHPENAVYVFGPEDGSVSQGIRTACHRFVTIPTLHCLNLGVAIGTVLYDREAKLTRVH